MLPAATIDEIAEMIVDGSGDLSEAKDALADLESVVMGRMADLRGERRAARERDGDAEFHARLEDTYRGLHKNTHRTDEDRRNAADERGDRRRDARAEAESEAGQ